MVLLPNPSITFCMTERHEHFTLKSNARIEYYTFFLESNKSNYKEKKGKKREKPKRLLPLSLSSSYFSQGQCLKGAHFSLRKPTLMLSKATYF